MENSMVVTQKLKELPCYVAILLLGIYPKDVKAGTLTYLYTHVHSIFTDRQFQCLSVDEWINKICYIHKMEYYSALRKKKFWHMPQHIWILRILCKVKWASHKKINTAWFHLLEILSVVKFIDTKWKGRGMRNSCLIRIEFHFCRMKKSSRDCTTMWMYLTLLKCTLKNG